MLMQPNFPSAGPGPLMTLFPADNGDITFF